MTLEDQPYKRSVGEYGRKKRKQKEGTRRLSMKIDTAAQAGDDESNYPQEIVNHLWVIHRRREPRQYKCLWCDKISLNPVEEFCK